MPNDEFEIKATGTQGERVWTRDKYHVAQFIADQAVVKLGYERAEVINTFGGIRSDVLYEVTPTHSRDSVAEDCGREPHVPERA